MRVGIATQSGDDTWQSAGTREGASKKYMKAYTNG